MNKNTKKIIVFSTISFLIGYLFQSYFTRIQVIPKEVDQKEFTLFWDVWKTMEEKYPFEEPTEDQKIFKAIQGLVASYDDPNSSFLPPVGAKIFQETVSGHFGGAGMEIGVRDGFLVIITPLKNSPAEKAGFLPGDIITHVDSVEIFNKSLDEATSLIRGEIGTQVTITVVRADEESPLDLTLTRDIVTIPIIDTEIVDDTFIISLYNFNKESEFEFKEALEEFKESNLEYLLLDVRNNPGGFLDSSIEISSYFLEQGKTVVTEDFGDSDREKYIHRSKGYPLLEDLEYSLGIIINKGSASASEILAGALQDHSQALVMGSQSYGKGSMQELIELDQDTSLKVTIGKWLTPEGRHISQKGITPDIEIDQTLDNDLFIKKAVKILKNS